MIEEYLERIKNYRIPEDLDKINREFFLYSAEKGLYTKKSPAAEIMDISGAG